MIARHLRMNNVSKSSVCGLIRYLTDTQGHGHRVGEIRTTNCYAEDPEWAGAEMWATQQKNYRAKGDKTYHLLVSFRENEKPSSAILKAVEDEICNALGFGEHERLSVVHNDTDNFHLHICINKIHPERLVIHEPYYDHTTLAKACERLEQQHGIKKDNHIFRAEAAETAAKSMEMAGDLESLTGWIQRNILKDIDKVQSWGELHTLLGEHGLSIQERGNGLVISNGNIHVKASSIHRQCSKKRMEERLGAFEKSPKQAQATKARYTKKPMQYKKDTSKLWEQFQAQRDSYEKQREAKLKKTQRERESELASVNFDARIQSQLIRYFVTDPTMRRILRALNKNKIKKQKQEIRQAYRTKKVDAPKRLTWRTWLNAEAMQNNLEAMGAIRARDKRQQRKVAQAQGQAVAITRRGTWIFVNGTRDTGLPSRNIRTAKNVIQHKNKGLTR